MCRAGHRVFFHADLGAKPARDNIHIIASRSNSHTSPWQLFKPLHIRHEAFNHTRLFSYRHNVIRDQQLFDFDTAQGSGDFSPLWSGQNASGCREQPTAEITRSLAEGFKASVR